jgi:hypothetical protein
MVWENEEQYNAGLGSWASGASGVVSSNEAEPGAAAEEAAESIR